MLDKDEQWVAFIDANSNLLLAYEDGSGGGLLAEGVSLAAVYMGDVCPKWSPDGRKIAFSTSMKNVTVKDVIDGSSISIGVDNDLSSFAWHPGGKMLAVIGVNTSGQGGVHLVNAQNGKELAYAPGRWAAFSPDGSRLAIVRWDNRESLTNQILIYDLVIDPSSGLATGYNPPETRTLYLDYLWNPLWSPDGQSLVFAGGIYGVGSGNTHIYLLKLDETDPICLYSDNLSPMQMAWSPDGDKLRDGERLSGGKQIAFIGAIQPDKGSASPLHAFVVKASGGGLKDLTDESDVYANCLSWAPDGSRLFYATPFHLYLAQADGSGLQEVNSVEGWYLGGFFRPMP
jgi:Tol biopolymer transport system component